MKRGFTIVEILVVVAVIAIVSTITVASYAQYQNQAYDAQARGLAAAVKSGAERYANVNHEYPSAATVFGGAPTGSIPANYATASQVLNVSLANLNGENAKLIPCAGGVCNLASPDKTKVYYLTKIDPPAAAAQAYTLAGCTFTFPNDATNPGTVAYIISYWSIRDNVWRTARSNNGAVITSDSTSCPFTAF